MSMWRKPTSDPVPRVSRREDPLSTPVSDTTKRILIDMLQADIEKRYASAYADVLEIQRLMIAIEDMKRAVICEDVKVALTTPAPATPGEEGK